MKKKKVLLRRRTLSSKEYFGRSKQMVFVGSRYVELSGYVLLPSTESVDDA